MENINKVNLEIDNNETDMDIESVEINEIETNPNKFRFREKKYSISFNLMKENFKSIDMGNFLFITAASVASAIFPSIISMSKDKKGLKDLKQSDLIDFTFCTLPTIFNLLEKISKGSGFEGKAGKLLLYSKFLTLTPAIKQLALNISNNDGKVNFEDSNLWIRGIPFIMNTFIIPTMGNPQILKSALFLVKSAFGKKIVEVIDDKTGGVMSKLGFDQDDIYDVASTGIDHMSEELKKRKIIENDVDPVTESLAQKGVSIVANLVVPKAKGRKSELSSAYVGARGGIL